MNMTRLANLFRQPLLHFLLIGAAIFAVYAVLDESPAATATGEIVVTSAKAEQLAAGFQSVWRRPPTAEELDRLVDDHIREEVLVREATALSLDRNDAVIRRRLRQKMEFLTDSAAGALKPSDDELRDHMEANAERYTSSAKIAFEQVFVGENPGGAEIDAARSALEEGTDPAGVGARTLLPASLPMSVRTVVDGTFGRGFFDAVADLETGAWRGPVRSGYGMHLVRVAQRAEGERLPFETVREAVLRDWTKAKAGEIADAHYQRMRARYVITRPDLSSVTVLEQ